MKNNSPKMAPVSIINTNKIKILMTISVLSFNFISFNSFAENNTPAINVIGNLKSTAIDNELLIRFKDNVKQKQIDELMAKYGLKVLKIITGIKVYQVQTPVEVKADKLIKILEKNSLIKYVELNHTVNMMDKSKEVKKMDYAKLIGKEVEVTGTYQSSRSGAVLNTENGSLSFLDAADKVLITVDKLVPGQKVTLKGTIKKAKGFNITNDLGIKILTISK